MKKQLQFNYLKSARYAYFSQSGEDGLLKYILSKIPNRNNWCVEFGAWDGIYLSNTFYFISYEHYNAVLIEADKKKYLQLSKNMNRYNAHCINAKVEASGKNSLDKLLSKTPVPLEFDLLSIDIDGNDYFIWESLKKFKPKVVIIEINIRNKPNVKIINDPKSIFSWGVTGTSIRSMTELAEKKGYNLIAQAGCNAIYVQNKFLKYFYNEKVEIEDLFTYEGFLSKELTKNELLRKKKWRYKKFSYMIKAICPEFLIPLATKLYNFLKLSKINF